MALLKNSNNAYCDANIFLSADLCINRLCESHTEGSNCLQMYLLFENYTCDHTIWGHGLNIFILANFFGSSSF